MKLVLAISLALLLPTPAQACPRAPAVDVEAARGAVLCLLNVERETRNLPRLRPNRALSGAAARYARRMVRDRFFSHDRPALTARVRSSGYVPPRGRWRVGENLAWGRGARADPRAIVRAWMKSAPHRHNVLNPRYRDVGIGLAPGVPVAGEPHGATYVTEFGVRAR
jgi:uncharacterized protein YkwD